MKFLGRLSLIASFCNPLFAFNPPVLQHGNQYEYAIFEGRLQVRCYDSHTGEHDYRTHFCRKEYMLPTAFSRVIFEGSSADQVILENSTESGESRKKSLRFYPSKGYSQEVNLGINTLTQRSLLLAGNNHITYKFLRKKQLLSEGNFEVRVSEGDLRQCENGYDNSNNMRDCRYYSEILCDRYLRSATCDGR